MDTNKLTVTSVLGALVVTSEVIRGSTIDIQPPLLPNVSSWDLTGISIMIIILYSNLIGGIYTSIIHCSIIFLRGKFAGVMFKLDLDDENF